LANFKKITTESVRGQQWDSSVKWDFHLEGLNDLFSGWIPATSIELDFFGVATEAMMTTGIEYISGRTHPKLTISFIDTEDLKVTKFITKWMKEMVSQDGYEVQTVQSAAKQFSIYKTKSTNETIYTWTGKVIPIGNLTYTGDSNASIVTYQIQFLMVAGSLKWG